MATSGGPWLEQGVGAGIKAIATHLPERVLCNDELARTFDWSAEKIFDKLGIRERRIAAEDETAADLAYQAALNLFEGGGCALEEIDFLIFCTQAPDYILPTSACLLQARLGLRRDIGALDINLGCSGFVYGLSLAVGLIASGAASNVLLLTADTYSKFIHQGDRSVRTLFGDGAAATLIRKDSGSRIGPFLFGTDGSGARSLMVETGGARMARCDATAVEVRDGAGNTRSRDSLYMNGAAVMSFTLREVPEACRQLLERTGTNWDDYRYFIPHQANKFMLDALQKKLGLANERMPRHFEAIGNTVSSTIPFVLEKLLADNRLAGGDRIMLLGFGVGLSWANASIIW
jgi:3-oxoacyl-[acyl-carrier-protein] synthase-3